MTRFSAALLLDDAAAARAGRQVAEAVSLTLGPGDALTLRGRNGSGKTSLLRAIAGVGRLSSGTCRIGAAAEPGERARLCHLVGHRPGARGAMTAAETLRFHADVLGGERDRIAGALERVGLVLEADRPAGAMSAGQLRRLSLARLLLADRPLWLLDEPTAALDTAGAEVVAGLVAEHRAAGGIVLAASHDAFAPEGAAELRFAA